ncbi:MAG: hypothetical protein KKC46_17475 [Proteobacteria bacterium]|nr:hypothetical protein [Pseudomonadota bacterium]
MRDIINKYLKKKASTILISLFLNGCATMALWDGKNSTDYRAIEAIAGEADQIYMAFDRKGHWGL